nr:immunoglobulin light chain junction region [Macaca mulatta]MOW41742.1 immunoglobulin light chain junction region [Macaca mulatta]MOW45335.1 immunoglobulin light chain junction region [Macaca mulatta]
CQHGYGIVFTF